jgi:hypothetical protein
VNYVLRVGFLDGVNGGEHTITLPGGKTLQVMIPEGAEDRQMLRLEGLGPRMSLSRWAMPARCSCLPTDSFSYPRFKSKQGAPWAPEKAFCRLWYSPSH